VRKQVQHTRRCGRVGGPPEPLPARRFTRGEDQIGATLAALDAAKLLD
jgi:hypothetical protein